MLSVFSFTINPNFRGRLCRVSYGPANVNRTFSQQCPVQIVEGTVRYAVQVPQLPAMHFAGLFLPLPPLLPLLHPHVVNVGFLGYFVAGKSAPIAAPLHDMELLDFGFIRHLLQNLGQIP